VKKYNGYLNTALNKIYGMLKGFMYAAFRKTSQTAGWRRGLKTEPIPRLLFNSGYASEDPN
jgi:hypothetical protein